MIWKGVLIALVASVTQAWADPLYSAPFTMEGRCNGNDMVYRWNGARGEAPYHEAGEYGIEFIYPWLDKPILIRGVELVVVPNSWLDNYSNPVKWLMVGNSLSPDIMLMVAGDRHGVNMFPGNSGFVFPAIKDMTDLTYVDLHGVCTWGRKVKVFLTLYYSYL